jgi:hypothetical protein
MPIGQMTQKFEKLCHSAYGFSVGNMLHRQSARWQNEMSPAVALPIDANPYNHNPPMQEHS